MVGNRSASGGIAFELVRSIVIRDPGIGEDEIRSTLRGALPELNGEELRILIVQSFYNKEEEKALYIAEEAIAYYMVRNLREHTENAEEIMGSAIGALCVFSTSYKPAKKVICKLLEDRNPVIVATVLNWFPKGVDLESFVQISTLLSRQELELQKKAIEHMEDCIKTAVFRKMGGSPALSVERESFLKGALAQLEKTYHECVAANNGRVSHVQKRLSIMLAMSYSELLDTSDWKRQNKVQIDENSYWKAEDRLHNAIAPGAMPQFFKMLGQANLDENVEQCALNTMGRLSNKGKHRKQIEAYMRNYMGLCRTPQLKRIAGMILESCGTKKRFSSIPAPALIMGRPTMVSRMPPPIRKGR